MLEKTIAIGDKQVKFRSSATIPRLYRVKFKRDIFKDLSRLESSYKGNSDGGSSFSIEWLKLRSALTTIPVPQPTTSNPQSKPYRYFPLIHFFLQSN